MVKINTRWKLAEDFNILRGVNYVSKVKYFWRKGWTEIPVIMACTPLSIVSLILVYPIIRYMKNHDLTVKYRRKPTVYRPDDPRVHRIRNYVWWDK